MRILLAMLLSVLPLCAQTNSVRFTWNASPAEESVILYRFYEFQINGTNRILLGTTTTNYFTVTNWNPLQSRAVSVTASNMLGESQHSVPLVVPKAPTPPVNLVPVHLSIESAPSIDFSYDLVDWRQKIKIWTNAPPNSTNAGKQMVTVATYPFEPAMFLRQTPIPSFTRPPTPGAQRTQNE